MINRNFAKENAKNNETRRKFVETPSYHVQSPSTETKCNKNFTKTPQTPKQASSNPPWPQNAQPENSKKLTFKTKNCF